jgi:heme/copper-type cytochrome/quinol oxidase subunit 2
VEIIIKIPKKVAEFWRRHEFFLTIMSCIQVVTPVLFLLIGALTGFSTAATAYPERSFNQTFLEIWLILTVGWLALYGAGKAVWWLMNHVSIVVEEDS